MGNLRIDTLTFDEKLRETWVDDDFAFLRNSKASPSIKSVLSKKARVRPNRFFGEAYVATQIDHDDGWYCPFKWLTSASWCEANANEDQSASADFRAALAKHFPDLRDFQNRVAEFVRLSGVEKPVGPDLWLIADNVHRFIEVKLAGDTLKPRQLAGLALLAECLPSAWPISVSVVNLESSSGQFDAFVDQIRRHNIQMEPTRR